MDIHFRIVAPDGKPIEGANVDVLRRNLGAGAWTPLLSGITNADGKLDVTNIPPPSDFLLTFRLSINGRFALETVEHVEGDNVDFGTIVVFPDPLFQFDGVNFYGINKAVFTAVAARAVASGRRGADAPVEAVLQTTANQMAQARDALLQRGLGVSTLSVEMKVLLPSPGLVKLLGEGDLPGIEAQQLSTIRFELDPLSTAAGEPKDAVVPAVLGYTEAIARRKLAAAGLSMIVSYQIVSEPAGGPSSVGRVVKQDRAPGTDAPRGSAVTVFLGKLAD